MKFIFPQNYNFKNNEYEYFIEPVITIGSIFMQIFNQSHFEVGFD